MASAEATKTAEIAPEELVNKVADAAVDVAHAIQE